MQLPSPGFSNSSLSLFLNLIITDKHNSRVAAPIKIIQYCITYYFFKEMSMEDIIAVARKANIHQFITNLPQVKR